MIHSDQAGQVSCRIWPPKLAQPGRNWPKLTRTDSNWPKLAKSDTICPKNSRLRRAVFVVVFAAHLRRTASTLRGSLLKKNFAPASRWQGVSVEKKIAPVARPPTILANASKRPRKPGSPAHFRCGRSETDHRPQSPVRISSAKTKIKLATKH